jgi:hypothetical protein
VQRILHNLQFHPYKLQIVQELKPNDSVLRLQFCENLFWLKSKRMLTTKWTTLN